MAKTLTMKYTLNTENPWIYCNYPEKIAEHPGCFGENGKAVNRQSVSAGTGQIFYSYNAEGVTHKMGIAIRVYNPGTSSISFKRLYYGHADSINNPGDFWNGMSYISWEKFFASTSKGWTIPAKGSAWICDESIPAKAMFSGNLRFSTSGQAVIAVYLYKNSKNDIPASTTVYPYDNKSTVYSGCGNGYFFTASPITIKATDIIANSSVSFETNNRSSTNCTVNNKANTSEIIPIKIAGTSLTASASQTGNLRNLANWCAQYAIPVKFVNDTNVKFTFVCACVNPDTKDKYPVIIDAGKVLHACLKTGNSRFDFKRISVPAGQTLEYTYQYILGTNSYGIMKHVFSQ